MQVDTRVDYVAMVRETVAEIQRRLDNPPTFRELADKAYFSPFHFHRVFRALAGESPAEIVRRLRLERAALQIRQTECSITEIAFEAGYATHEAFTKAFQSEFGMTPSAFRAAGSAVCEIACPNRLHYIEGGFTLFNLVKHGDLKMKTEVLDMPPMRVASIRHKGPYHEIGSTFEKLGQKAGPMGLFTQPNAIGIAVYLDDPDSKPAEELEALAGITVSETAPIADLEEYRLLGGRYLKAEYIGPYSGLGNAWNVVCGKLVPEGGHQLRGGPPFELYTNSCVDTPAEDLRTEIYVPIA